VSIACVQIIEHLGLMGWCRGNFDDVEPHPRERYLDHESFATWAPVVIQTLRTG